MPDRNAELRQIILELAARYQRYGAGMIYLKLRQQGRRVNHKRVDRLYTEAQLQLRRRTRKKVLMGAVSRWRGLTRRTMSGRWISCLIAVRKAESSSV